MYATVYITTGVRYLVRQGRGKYLPMKGKQDSQWWSDGEEAGDGG